ncbi:MAG: DUF285 domain-containing protein [Erysipelotrichaceae bacterium]|nr:DUF285 domain-containing protein [Erysipelotrichaceae bacterium]
MKKFIKLLLVGLLCISLIGCSSSSDDSNNDDSSSDTITETSSDETDDTNENNYSNSGEVVTTLSGNVLAEIDQDSNQYYNQWWYNSDIKTITFLDNLDYIPSEYYNYLDVSENGDGSVIAWIEETNDGLYDLYIAGDGGVDANSNSHHLFYCYTSLTEINFNDCFCTSSVTDMSDMFWSCSSLTSLDLSSFDTSNVTDMSDMFYNCKSLNSLNLSNFNTSNVTDMERMFYDCNSLNSLDLSNFNTSNVTDMYLMFCDCKSLTSLDLSNFDMVNVEDYDSMFENCESLTDIKYGVYFVFNNTSFINCPAGDDYY